MKEISPGGKEKKEELKCPDNYTASRGDLWQAGSSAASAPPPPPPSPSSPGPAGGGGSEPSHTGPSPPPVVPSISARPPPLIGPPGGARVEPTQGSRFPVSHLTGLPASLPFLGLCRPPAAPSAPPCCSPAHCPACPWPRAGGLAHTGVCSGRLGTSGRMGRSHQPGTGQALGEHFMNEWNRVQQLKRERRRASVYSLGAAAQAAEVTAPPPPKTVPVSAHLRGLMRPLLAPDGGMAPRGQSEADPPRLSLDVPPETAICKGGGQ